MPDEHFNQTSDSSDQPKQNEGVPGGPEPRYKSGPHETPPPTFTPPWMSQQDNVPPPPPPPPTNYSGRSWSPNAYNGGMTEQPASMEGQSLVDAKSAEYGTIPPHLRFVFGDMIGVVFWVWIPVILAFFVPWDRLVNMPSLPQGLTAGKVMVALIISIPPWVVLTRHLSRGHLWDGILDMFLWAIWECIAVITLAYLYPERAQQVIWNSSSYWADMRTWIQTGQGTEGNSSLWIPLQLKHLIYLVAGSFIFGLPALAMGVLQLNYMNFYVARCMASSSEPLLVLAIAWHFWSVIRVAGYIIIASTIYQLEISGFNSKNARFARGAVASGLVIGIILVLLDFLLKWQFSGTTQQILQRITNL
jgi:hypothetical protein